MGALYFSALLFYKLKISLKNEVCYIKSMKNFKGKISQDSIAKCVVQTKLVMVTQRTGIILSKCDQKGLCHITHRK